MVLGPARGVPNTCWVVVFAFVRARGYMYMCVCACAYVCMGVRMCLIGHLIALSVTLRVNMGNSGGVSDTVQFLC